MNSHHGLSEKTVSAIRTVFERYPGLTEAVLFGSRAKGTYKPGSDIDLVLLGPDLSHRMVSRISSDLDDLPIPYQFSLVLDQEMIDPDIRAHVARVGLSFYQRNATPLP